MRSTLALVGALLVAAGCGGGLGDQHEEDGAIYVKAMADLIRRSDRIVATEHSDEFDLYDDVAGKSEIEKQLVYGHQELTSQQKAYFLTTIESLDPTTQDAFPACIPAVHHTFRFYSGAALLDTVDVCFECGQVIWEGTRAYPPWSLYPGLAKVVEHIGFSTERDWPAIARQHLKNPRSNTSLERTREK